jgi:putative membrane protein insertion efficiency factor
MIKHLFIRLVLFYQRRISPLFPPMCRYYPTCSNYVLQAIEIHGFAKGLLLGILRILRCNQLFKGGYDPVPPKKQPKK